MSSWIHIFDSLIGISILNISMVPPTDHIQTLAPLSFSKNPPPLPSGFPLCAHQIKPEVGTLSPSRLLPFLKKIFYLFGCIRTKLWCMGSKVEGLVAQLGWILNHQSTREFPAFNFLCLSNSSVLPSSFLLLSSQTEP